MLLLELQRRHVVDAAVRAHGVVVSTPDFDHDGGLGPGAEPLDRQALVAEAAVEAFVGAVLPGLAGTISAVPMPPVAIHSRIARLTNSGPLSERRKSGAPCVLTRRVSTSIIRCERIDPATSIARHSRVNSSTTVRHFIWRPSAVASKLTEVLASDVDRPLADLVLARRLGDRRAVGVPQDGNHLLFPESTHPHGLLAVDEPSSQELYGSEESGQVIYARATPGQAMNNDFSEHEMRTASSTWSRGRGRGGFGCYTTCSDYPSASGTVDQTPRLGQFRRFGIAAKAS